MALHAIPLLLNEMIHFLITHSHHEVSAQSPFGTNAHEMSSFSLTLAAVQSCLKSCFESELHFWLYNQLTVESYLSYLQRPILTLGLR